MEVSSVRSGSKEDIPSSNKQATGHSPATASLTKLGKYIKPFTQETKQLLAWPLITAYLISRWVLPAIETLPTSPRTQGKVTFPDGQHKLKNHTGEEILPHLCSLQYIGFNMMNDYIDMYSAMNINIFFGEWMMTLSLWERCNSCPQWFESLSTYPPSPHTKRWLIHWTWVK